MYNTDCKTLVLIYKKITVITITIHNYNNNNNYIKNENQKPNETKPVKAMWSFTNTNNKRLLYEYHFGIIFSFFSDTPVLGSVCIYRWFVYSVGGSIRIICSLVNLTQWIKWGSYLGHNLLLSFLMVSKGMASIQIFHSYHFRKKKI